MKLKIHELMTTLTQGVTITKPKEVKYLRLYLYLHSSPAGSLKVAIKYNDEEVASHTQSIADIKAGLEDDNTYYHGYIRFTFDPVFLGPGTYSVELSGVGYTFSESAYIGWVEEFEDLKNNLGSGIAKTLAYEPWSYNEV